MLKKGLLYLVFLAFCAAFLNADSSATAPVPLSHYASESIAVGHLKTRKVMIPYAKAMKARYKVRYRASEIKFNTVPAAIAYNLIACIPANAKWPKRTAIVYAGYFSKARQRGPPVLSV